MAHHIAQVNIGRVKGPMNSTVMHGFASRLDDTLLINMSVWETLSRRPARG
jgi:hypothetical protein